MKKTLLLLGGLTSLLATAAIQPIDLTTQRITSVTNRARITIPGVCTNVDYTAVNTNYPVVGDTLPIAFGKVNDSFVQVSGSLTTNTADIAGLKTNVPNLNLAGYIKTSRRLQTWGTNFITWSTSNYLARVPGLLDWEIHGGLKAAGDMVPPTNIPIALYGSYDGTTGWFKLTNGFATSNSISLATLSEGGGTGFFRAYGLDNWTSFGVTNSYDGQTWLVNGSPIASQKWVADYAANCLDKNWQSYYSNGLTHLFFRKNGRVIMDLAAQRAFLPVTAWLDNTNFILQTMATNLTSGWELLSSTNLNLTDGFTMWTNFTAGTNAGVVNFTNPIPADTMRFWLLVAPSTNTLTIDATVTANKYNGDGSGLTNVNAAAVQGLTAATLVSITNPAPGALAYFNGTNWTIAAGLVWSNRVLYLANTNAVPVDYWVANSRLRARYDGVFYQIVSDGYLCSDNDGSYRPKYNKLTGANGFQILNYAGLWSYNGIASVLTLTNDYLLYTGNFQASNFMGNGAGLTNLAGPVITYTNWVVNQYYTNTSGRSWLVKADQKYTTAASSAGTYGFQLLYDPTGGKTWQTNADGVNVVPAVGVAITFANTLSGAVPAGACFVWTNLSTAGTVILQTGQRMQF